MCANWQVVEHQWRHRTDKIIREDEIDILFDYADTTLTAVCKPSSCSLRLFKSWVEGLISSTGLVGMDYLLSDAIETPAEWADSLYTES